MMALLRVEDLTKRFEGLVVSDRINIEVAEGEVHAIIGPNGAGKTTLVSQLAGELHPDAGRIQFDDRDVTKMPAYARALLGIARSFQISSVLPEFSAIENVAIAIQARAGHSFKFWRAALGADVLRGPARAMLEQVGLGSRAGLAAGHLAYGEKRALELAMVLCARPRMLLLDEPMAGMGTDESERIIQFLASLKRKVTMILIEHDMNAVFALADRISVLVYGRVVITGSPDEVRRNEDVRRAYLGGHGQLDA